MRALPIALVLLALACDQQPDAAAPATGATESLTYDVATTTDAASVGALADDLALAGRPGHEAFVGRILPGGLRLGITSVDDTLVRLQYEPDTGRDGWAGETRVAAVEVPRAVAVRFADMLHEAAARLEAHRALAGGTDDYVPFEIGLRAEGQDGNTTLVVAERSGRFRVSHRATTPRRWIGGERHGQPIDRVAPHARITCTVGFHIELDELNYFVDRAYGRLSFERAGFDNFRLGGPHDWFTVTVEHWPNGRASTVMFRVSLPDGSWVPFASAPAGKEMGDLFINAFNSGMASDPGAAEADATFSIPYYYDDSAGGVVQVRVAGEAGLFTVFYELQTPWFGATDALPAPLPITVDPPEGPGRLLVRFSAADEVRTSPHLVDPLRGRILAAVYRAADVSALGPTDGAVPLESITLENVDLAAPGATVEYTTGDLPSGDVKVLGFFDLDSAASPDPTSPDSGDPVTVPLSSLTVVGDAITPVDVPFDLVF